MTTPLVIKSSPLKLKKKAASKLPKAASKKTLAESLLGIIDDGGESEATIRDERIIRYERHFKAKIATF